MIAMNANGDTVTIGKKPVNKTQIDGAVYCIEKAGLWFEVRRKTFRKGWLKHNQPVEFVRTEQEAEALIDFLRRKGEERAIYSVDE